MKVEVELPPGVYPTDAEVQELLRKFQEIKSATFKFRLQRTLLDHLRRVKSIEGKVDVAAQVAIEAFGDLLYATESDLLNRPPEKQSLHVSDLRIAVLERLGIEA